MSLVPANPLMSEPCTTGEGRDIVTLFTGQDAIRALMEEFCTNVSKNPSCTTRTRTNI
jgi:hypothetical protein